jgi:hypothetical protein
MVLTRSTTFEMMQYSALNNQPDLELGNDVSNIGQRWDIAAAAQLFDLGGSNGVGQAGAVW